MDRMIQSMGTQVQCSSCNQSKQLSDFQGKDSDGNIVLRKSCYTCRVAYMKQREQLNGKMCKECTRLKPINSFYRDKITTTLVDGRIEELKEQVVSTYCKDCRSCFIKRKQPEVPYTSKSVRISTR